MDTQSRVINTIPFLIPQHNGYVDFVTFLASIRGYSRNYRLVKSANINAAHLRKIYINQQTADRICFSIREAKMWPVNQHGIVVSFLHHRFHLDNEMKNSEFRLEYRVRPIVEHDVTIYPGTFHSEGNNVRGSAAIDRN